MQLGTEVMRASALSDVPSIITEYNSDSDYVSSTERYTPFPSLTLSKKIELEKYIHNGDVTYNISTFSEPDIPKLENQQPEQDKQEISKQYENNGCCLLL